MKEILKRILQLLLLALSMNQITNSYLYIIDGVQTKGMNVNFIFQGVILLCWAAIFIITFIDVVKYVKKLLYKR